MDKKNNEPPTACMKHSGFGTKLKVRMKPTYSNFNLKNSLLLFFGLLTIACQNKLAVVQPSATTNSTMEVQKQGVEKEDYESADSVYSAKILKVDSLDLNEVNTHFTFKGNPINPMLVKTFVPWISDPIPSYMALDIMASSDANLFFSSEPISVTEDGFVVAKEKSDFDGSFDYYKYKWLGMLNNKTHVLKFIEENENSSGVYINLVFVQFELSAVTYNGHSYTQLLMKNKGGFSLGDRTPTEIILQKKSNSLTLKKLDQETNKWLIEEIQL